jgi:hypothetical protein
LTFGFSVVLPAALLVLLCDIGAVAGVVAIENMVIIVKVIGSSSLIFQVNW